MKKLVTAFSIALLAFGCKTAGIMSDNNIPRRYQYQPLDKEYWDNYPRYLDNPKLTFFTSLGALDLAELAYGEKEDVIGKLRDLGFHEPLLMHDRKTSTEGFIAGQKEGNYIIISMKGTREILDFILDMKVLLRSKDEFRGKVHAGFFKAYLSVKKGIFGYLNRPGNRRKKIILTGHSLGGAIVTLFALKLRESGFHVYRVFTFGSPRVGNKSFARACGESLSDIYFRFVNGDDVVTKLPPVFYRHAGRLFYFDEEGRVLHDSEGALPYKLLWLVISRKFKELKEELKGSLRDHFLIRYRERIWGQLRFG